mmetsp:Transcript_29877/g.49468  ORF Transcript_29877/g.49468 Transcript_29877/m.49468 type:complete len:240 (-) Transcript_29877:54-773(-)
MTMMELCGKPVVHTQQPKSDSVRPTERGVCAVCADACAVRGVDTSAVQPLARANLLCLLISAPACSKMCSRGEFASKRAAGTAPEEPSSSGRAKGRRILKLRAGLSALVSGWRKSLKLYAGRSAFMTSLKSMGRQEVPCSVSCLTSGTPSTSIITSPISTSASHSALEPGTIPTTTFHAMKAGSLKMSSPISPSSPRCAKMLRTWGVSMSACTLPCMKAFSYKGRGTTRKNKVRGTTDI